MLIDCGKCSSKIGCVHLASRDFSNCWQYREVIKEKKEKIAIEAMKAMLTNPSLVIGKKNDTPSSIARISVMIADEMMNLLKLMLENKSGRRTTADHSHKHKAYIAY